MHTLMWAEDPDGCYCLGYAGNVVGFLAPATYCDMPAHEFYAIDKSLSHLNGNLWATRQAAVDQISFECICAGFTVAEGGEQ